MKANNIFRFFAVLMAASFVMASCGGQIEPEGGNENGSGNGGATESPVFPSLVENYQVSPGETLSLTIEPNMDWTVSVPEENPQWFSILDGTLKVTKLSGKASAGKVTVKIVVSDREEFDTNRSTEVSLTMGGKTQVIAKYMRPAKEKMLSVYEAKRGEDGELQLAEDGKSYVYGAEPVTSLDLEWSTADADFRAPVKVEANCEWVLENTNDWLEVNVPETTEGVVELVFTGISVEDKTGNISFKSGDKVVRLDVSIASCAGIEVYSAQSAGGEWEFVDGEYKWSDEPVSDITMVWMADCRMPVKINSKCNWTLNTPEWMKVELPEKTSGEIEVVLLGDPMKYPLDDASGKIEFMLENEKLHELTVNIPGCRNRMSYTIGMNMTEFDFNYAGDIKTELGYVESSATATVTGTSGVSVFAVECAGGVYDAEKVNPQWLTISVSEYQKGGEVLQTRDVTISVKENTGDERKAMVFFLPSDMSGKISALFNDAMTEVKEEYKANAIALVQYSNDMEYLAIDATDDEMAEAGTEFTQASEDKREVLTAQFGQTNYVYSLKYQYVYSRDAAFLQMARPFTSYKIFDEAYADKTSDSSFWLMYTNQLETKNYGVIDMYHDMSLPKVSSVGYVVFYDSNENVLAIVECISPKIVPTLDVERTSLSFTVEEGSASLKISSNVSWSVSSDASWCTVDPATGEGAGTITVSVEENTAAEARSAKLTISSTDTEMTKVVEVHQEGKSGDEEETYVFKNGDDVVHFVDPEAAEAAFASVERLTSGDIYDDYKSGSAPVYHLIYRKENTPLNITIPSTVVEHNVNPWSASSNFSVNGTVYGEYFGPNDILNEVVRDENGSVAIHMTMPSDKNFIRGNINFTKRSTASASPIVLILVCTLDLTAAAE